MTTTLTPQEVYEKLLNEDQILTLQGRIQFTLGDVNIIVKQKDVVGNIIQEWLEGWLTNRNIAFSRNENTQMPPDLFLNEDKTKDLLEVKAFNRSASPGFDIADFKAYQKEIVTHPYMLHAKYIIFGYGMSDEGVVTIRSLWLKNVWEICRTSEKWPINVQFKNNMVHKIRPAQWFSDGQRIKYPTYIRTPIHVMLPVHGGTKWRKVTTNFIIPTSKFHAGTTLKTNIQKSKTNKARIHKYIVHHV